MGLEHIKGCRLIPFGKYSILVSGVSKTTGEEVKVCMDKLDFKLWQDGFPLNQIAAYLTPEEREFLRKGV